MSSFWFIVAFVFFILWLSKKPKVKSNDQINPNSPDYIRGYKEGYIASKNGVVSVLETSDNTDNLALTTEYVGAELPAEPEVDPAEQKEKNNLKNINVTLYIASFLLVGAATLFIGAAMDESIRFVGIWFVTIAFYAAGLAIYNKIEKLRPAAVAFTGTGLALIPFTGMAMYSLVLHDAPICWFVTSVVGLIAFIIAATRLQSQVISYIAIAFGASFATSSIAILHVGLMWSFVVLILFGALITFIAGVKSSWVSACFSKPIQQSNQWIVPLTLVASLFATTGLTTQDYAIISIVSAIYYGAVAVSSVEGREIAIFFARVLASISAVLMTYDISHSWTSVGLAISIISVLQLVVSALSLPEHTVGDANNETWLWLGFIAQLSGMLFVLQDTSWAYITTGQLLVLLTTSFGLSYLLRRSLVSVFGSIALAILPILIGSKVIQPVLERYWVALVFIAFSAGVLAVRTYVGRINISPLAKSLLFINLGLFMVEALILTAGVPDGWGFGIWITASLLLYCSVYIERLPQLIVVANIVLLITSLWFVKLIDVDIQWMSIVISWLTFGVFYGAYWLAVDMSKKAYGVYFWWSAVIVTGIINLTNLFGYSSKSIVTIAGLGVVVVALVLAVEGYKTRRYAYFDAGAIMATIGLQRLVGVASPDINFLVYTHWWAIVFAGLSYMYYVVDKQHGSKIRLIIALFMVSFFTGTAALGDSGYSDIPYKSIFLAEHIAILIIGSVLSRKLISIWGAVGIVLAVLWMLKGYTWLMLVVAALALIMFAVYALNKQSKNAK